MLSSTRLASGRTQPQKAFLPQHVAERFCETSLKTNLFWRLRKSILLYQRASVPLRTKSINTTLWWWWPISVEFICRSACAHILQKWMGKQWPAPALYLMQQWQQLQCLHGCQWSTLTQCHASALWFPALQILLWKLWMKQHTSGVPKRFILLLALARERDPRNLWPTLAKVPNT